MNELDIEEIKKLQVDILFQVDKFCKKNSLRYFMGYGTLLGAVRHKGYIPWDDDIDIGMPRPDYDRFLNIFNGSFDNLSVVAPELDWEWIDPYANVYDNRTELFEIERKKNLGIGVKIDVFPIDGVPDDFEQYVKLRKRLQLLFDIRSYKLYGLKDYWELMKKPKSLAVIVGRLIPYTFTSIAQLQRMIRREATKNDFTTSQFVDKITFQNKPLTRLPRRVYEEYIEMAFEGHKFMALKDYDAHLKAIYGDYMQLPPENQRIPHHGFKAYWK